MGIFHACSILSKSPGKLLFLPLRHRIEKLVSVCLPVLECLYRGSLALFRQFNIHISLVLFVFAAADQTALFHAIQLFAERCGAASGQLDQFPLGQCTILVQKNQQSSLPTKFFLRLHEVRNLVHHPQPGVNSIRCP